MRNRGGLNIRSLLAFTALTAISLTSLVVPSVWTGAMLAVTITCVIVYGVQRMAAVRESRPFWLGYFAGMLSLTFFQISLLLAIESDPFATFPHAIWRMLFSEDFNATAPLYARFQKLEFNLRVVIVLLFPAVIAGAMTFFTRAEQSA